MENSGFMLTEEDKKNIVDFLGEDFEDDEDFEEYENNEDFDEYENIEDGEYENFPSRPNLFDLDLMFVVVKDERGNNKLVACGKDVHSCVIVKDEQGNDKLVACGEGALSAETKNPEVENTVPVKPCRYGAECHGLKNGRCPFNHPEPVAKTTKPCKYGFECYGFKNGRCPFIHN